jgi:guanylate kinase
MIISLTGPSGAGKTTLLHNLLKALPNARPLTSTTTRAPRPTDEPGEYHYVSDEEFDAMARAGAFLWQVGPHGKRYATTQAMADEALEDGVVIPVLTIEAAQFLNTYARQRGKEQAVTFLYVSLPGEGALRARLEARGDLTPKELEARVAECRSWDARARESGVPFIYIDASGTKKETLARALAAAGR